MAQRNFRFLCQVFLLVPTLCFCASVANAQTQTNVTATVKDSIGIPYSNGTYSVQLIPSGTNPTVNGKGIGGAFNGRMDANGSFNISLWPNTSISPGGTVWQFTICVSPGVAPPLGTGGQCTPPTSVTITGSSQSLSVTLSAVAPSLTAISVGTTAPGGSSGQLEFNNSGIFGGVAGSSVDGSGNIVLTNNLTANTLNAGSGGVNSTGSITATANGVNPGELDLPGQTTAPSTLANSAGLLGPNSATFTGYDLQFSATAPTGGNQVALIGAPSSGVSQVTYGAVNLATMITGQLPIGNVGSAGLSGTSPVGVAATGAVSCSTCLVTNLATPFQSVAAPITGTSAAAVYYTYTTPAAIGAGKGIRITALAKHTTGTASVTYTMTFGGTTNTGAGPPGAGNQLENCEYLIMNKAGVQNAQEIQSVCRDSNAGTNSIKLDTAAIDTSVSGVVVNLLFNVANTDAITPEMFLVEAIQ